MSRLLMMMVAVAAVSLALPAMAAAPGKPRGRDLGVPFDGTPGPLNAITDVSGVEVGYATLIRGTGPLRVGTGPVRTGVTAILPHDRLRAALKKYNRLQ